MNLPIYIAAIEHMSGMDFYIDTTEAALDARLAAHCRSHWETIPWKGEVLPDIPETDALTLELYFDDHENDSLTTDCVRLELPLTLREQVADVWGTADDYPRSDWQYEVCNGDSHIGYWEWVEHMRESNGVAKALAIPPPALRAPTLRAPTLRETITAAVADERDAEDLQFSKWDWVQLVAQRSLTLGYWEWVKEQRESIAE